MPTPLIVGQFLRVRVWTNMPTQKQAAVNTLFYAVAAVGATPATDQNVATQLEAAMAPNYKPALVASAEWRGVQCQILSSVSPYPALFSEVFSNAHAGNGTGPSGPLPLQCTGLISYQTGMAGRQYRGRSYIAFPAVGDDDGTGKPVGSYITQLGLIASDFVSGWSIVSGPASATLVRVLMHRKPKVGPLPVPTPVLGTVISDAWATQRRRGAFGRTNLPPI